MTAACPGAARPGTAWPDADLGDEIAAGLHGPPPVDLAAFEAALMALVPSWDRFYDATLARVEAGWGQPPAGGGTVATFTRIWSRAAGLALGPSVLDVGTCFGFLPLAWTTRPRAPRLLAAELSHASAALLRAQADRLGRAVGVVRADGAHLPLPARAVSSVLLVHVLEHLPPAASHRVLQEALRVADRRVVVAVPVEAVPDPVFGHLQVFDLRRLADLGRRTGWHASLLDADGAWLVLDRPEEMTCRSS